MDRSFWAAGAAVTFMFGPSSFLQLAATAPAPASPITQCDLPRYTALGDFLLSKYYREWIFVEFRLTLNALNGGYATFPAYRNVDIKRCTYDAYKQTSAKMA